MSNSDATLAEKLANAIADAIAQAGIDHLEVTEVKIETRQGDEWALAPQKAFICHFENGHWVC